MANFRRCDAIENMAWLAFEEIEIHCEPFADEAGREGYVVWLEREGLTLVGLDFDRDCCEPLDETVDRLVKVVSLVKATVSSWEAVYAKLAGTVGKLRAER